MKRSPLSSSSSTHSARHALVDELLFLGQMSSTETALFHQAAADHAGLNITDTKTMSVLMQEGPMTAGELAVRLSLTSGAVTSVIDRLEIARLVKRHRDPEDRRRVIVTINEKNLPKMGDTYNSMGASFAKLLERYSDKELKLLIDYHKQAVQLTTQEIAKLAKKSDQRSAS